MKPTYGEKFHFMAALMIVIVLAGLFNSGCVLDDSPVMERGGDEDGDFDWSGSGSGRLGIMVTPPTESGFSIQQSVLDMDEFDGTVTLKDSVMFSGEVQEPDPRDPSKFIPTEATITLVPGADIAVLPGHPPPNVNVQTNALAQGVDKTTFSASLLRGVYSLYVFPQDDSSAPPIVYHESFNVQDDLFKILRFEEGLVVDGLVIDEEGGAIRNAKVVAYDPEVWKRSNVALTDNKGRFELKLSVATGAYTVKVTGSEENPLFPKLEMEDAIRVSGDKVSRIEPANAYGQLEVVYGVFSRTGCSLSGRILGEPSGERGSEPVEGATLTFSALIGGGTFTTTTVTDEEGRYSVELIRTSMKDSSDDYGLSIRPPVESSSQSMRVFDIECPFPTLGDQDFELEKRLLLSGTVTDMNDEALSGVEVQAKKKATDQDPSTTAKTALTGPNGLYRMALDPGIYDLVFIPPHSSGLGREILTDIQTSTDGTINQKLLPGERFAGIVTDEEGVPAPWSYIEVLRFRPATETVELIGVSASDEEGFFEIVLPYGFSP